MFFGVVLISLLTCWAAPPVEAQTLVTARVISLTGTLRVERARLAPRSMVLNDPVAPGDGLITCENSYAIIESSTGATIQIFPDSHIIFNEQSADVQEFLHLFFGSIKVYIEKLTGRPNPHKMTTPTAVIAVRGTTFSVFVDENDSTLVAVDEGMVSVANIRVPAQEVILGGGQRTWVHAGQPPLAAQAFRGRSEQADLIPPRMGEGSTEAPARAMQRTMNQQMGSMSGSRASGGMPGHSPMKE
jgi:hypothetical protein